MPLTLYTYEGSTRSAKGLICAQYCNIKVDVPPFKMGEDNKTKDFLKMNPNGKVPTLKTDDGCIYESNAIARYIANMRPDCGLYGCSFYEHGLVDQWVDWCSAEVDGPVANWIYPLLGFGQYRQNEETIAKKKVGDLLKIMNDHLLNHTFFVGERITLADIVIACTLLLGYQKLFDANFRKPYGNVNRWFVTCVNQPEFIKVLGKVELCTKMLEYQKPKKEEKPKAEKAPKEEAKPAPKKEEKPKNPFDLLPPSKFVLDDWLRAYSNYHAEDDKIMEEFWPVFDNEGYSLWLCDYLYDTDNTVLFMTENFVDGFIQRSDALRKYAFGIMIVYGDDEHKPYKVKGAWLIRGKEIAPMLDNNPDAEYFQWTEVKLDNEENKKKLVELWCNKQTHDGLPIQMFNQFK